MCHNSTMKRSAGAAQPLRTKKPKKADVARSYRGFTIPSSTWSIDRVDVLQTTP